MSPAPTIAARATAAGSSPRAILRLSGPDVPDVLRDLGVDDPSARGCRVVTIRLRGGSFPAMLLRFRPPHSYTGEDAAEIVLPGSTALLDRVLAAVLAIPGVRAAGPGEFTARAFLSGRLSLDQAEGVAGVIAAETIGQLHAAREVLDGRAGVVYRGWADTIAQCLALVEAGIDFTDQEDVVPITPSELARHVRTLDAEIRGYLGDSTAREHAGERAMVVLFGAPNAGKSTLFNALVGRDRAIASPIAGTTRDVLVERLDLSGDLPGAGEVDLADAPGLDPGAAGIDLLARDAAGRAARQADVLVWCDPDGRFDGPDPDRPTIRVRTKADRPSSEGAATADVEVCAYDGFGMRELRRRIAQRAFASASSAVAVVPRHRQALSRVLDALREAAGAFEEHRPTLRSPELVAAALRSAADAMGEITGRVDPDTILGRIFAGFCIGK